MRGLFRRLVRFFIQLSFLTHLQLERFFLLFHSEKVFTHGLTDTVAAALPRLNNEVVGVKSVFLGVDV